MSSLFVGDDIVCVCCVIQCRLKLCVGSSTGLYSETFDEFNNPNKFTNLGMSIFLVQSPRLISSCAEYVLQIIGVMRCLEWNLFSVFLIIWTNSLHWYNTGSDFVDLIVTSEMDISLLFRSCTWTHLVTITFLESGALHTDFLCIVSSSWWSL